MKRSKRDAVTNYVSCSWVFSSDNTMEPEFCSVLSFVCKYNIYRYKMNTCIITFEIISKLQKSCKNNTKNASSRFLNCYDFTSFALLYSLSIHTYYFVFLNHLRANFTHDASSVCLLTTGMLSNTITVQLLKSGTLIQYCYIIQRFYSVCQFSNNVLYNKKKEGKPGFKTIIVYNCHISLDYCKMERFLFLSFMT